MKENKLIKGLDFTWDEIFRARKEGRLLSFDLELSRACNLRCIYCYAESGIKRKNELTKEEIFDVIDQAVELGAEKVVIIGGGEPLMYPYYWEVLQKVRDVGLDSITFTNGTFITKDVARRLYEMKEDLAVKFNSFDENTQDYLAGRKGTGRKIKKSIKNLLEVGYSSSEDSPQLALETIVCKQNYHEIERFYKFCRENNIIPYVEILTVQGRGKTYKDELIISPCEAYELFKRLKEYDEKVWGITWPLTPPIAGQNCKRMYYSAYITSTGDVQPCPGVDIPGGNIREKSLKEIINNSKIFRIVRNIDKYIKEPCKSCKYAKETRCYGCRGTALHHTGDFLNPDPTCWWLKNNIGGEKNDS